MRKAASHLAVWCALSSATALLGEDAANSKTYLVKLGVPVSTKASKPGDKVRAAIISPETLLNGYLEGTVQEVSSKPAGKLLLKFNTLLFKGKATALESEVVDFVNSKGHKSVDDSERPVRLQHGALLATGSELCLDEGSELRVRATAVESH